MALGRSSSPASNRSHCSVLARAMSVPDLAHGQACQQLPPTLGFQKTDLAEFDMRADDPLRN
jgi:hypothetical protein